MKFSHIINPLHSNFHYYGWGYIIDQLKSTTDLSTDGIVLDSFVDSYFWSQKKAITTPWIGIVHSAIKHQPTREKGFSIDRLIELPEMQESLAYCQGLITLTKHTQNYLQSKVDLPIYHTFLPRKLETNFFDIEAYFSNPILRHSGFELRDVSKFFLLETSLHKELDVGQRHNFDLILNELNYHNVHITQGNVKILTDFLPNDRYIKKFTSTIGFAYYYDCGASHSITEHIASHSPIVINKIPPIVEYLGEDYPMYYEKICNNLDLFLKDRTFIQATVDYLRAQSTRKEFTIEHFCEFVNQL